MTKKRAGSLIALSCFALLMAIPFIQQSVSNANTSITITENKHNLSISADFPERRSKAVQDYLKQQLNLSDLSDLNDLEIKQYSTPDRLMRFHIKSRPGLIELTLNKRENNQYAYNKMKATGKEIERILTH